MHIKLITLSNYINRTLKHYSIDLIGIEITIKNKKFELLFIYILPFSNPNANVFNDIFSLMSCSSIIRGDFNRHYLAWSSSVSDFRSNRIHSSLSFHDICILNIGTATRINRPPYLNTAIDLSVSSLIFHFPVHGLCYLIHIRLYPIVTWPRMLAKYNIFGEGSWPFEYE